VGGHDVIDHGPSPATVLAHGQEFGQSVVPLGQRREQLLRETIPIAGDVRQHGSSSGEKISL
jgi:hypothetical protein